MPAWPGPSAEPAAVAPAGGEPRSCRWRPHTACGWLACLYAALLAVPLAYRLRTGGSCSAYWHRDLSGLYPGRPWSKKTEWLWMTINMVGVRSLSVFMKLLPVYRPLRFAASPAHDGSGARLALTIDDAVGDDGVGFEELLRVLAERHVLATFFTIADYFVTTDEGARLLRLAAFAGHELANHGLHEDSMNDMSREEFAHAVAEWERRIKRVLPSWPVRLGDRKWFRPPKARMSSAMVDVLRERGYDIALGDVWSDDTGDNDRRFHSRVIEGAACDGSIIILHCPDRSSRNQTLGIIADTAPLLQARGLRFERLSDLVAQETPGVSPCGICGPCMWCILILLLVTIALAIQCVALLLQRQLWRLWRHRAGPCAPKARIELEASQRPFVDAEADVRSSVDPEAEQPMLVDPEADRRPFLAPAQSARELSFATRLARQSVDGPEAAAGG